jgi:hypothetical protein
MNTIEWTRVKNDVNGNPRWVCHFFDLELTHDYTKPLPERYEAVLGAARGPCGR